MERWSQIGVVGAGTMGSGIAQVAAQSGCDVVLLDQSNQVLEASEKRLASVFERLVAKDRVSTEESQRIQGRIRRTTNLGDLKKCEVVIEAIVENLEVKSRLFQELEQVVRPSTILATNTSSLSVTALAKSCAHPERVIGMHFFNPAPLMALVEVVPALQTDSSLVQMVTQELESWGKTVAVAKDTPGFIVNRIARPFYSEAIRMLEEGLASVQDIDASMREHGFRMGPFELMDMIGHDVNYSVTSGVHAAMFGDPRYQPSHTQRQLVNANWLGRKTGMGFYPYDDQGNKAVQSGAPIDGVAERILAMLMNEAADAVFWQIASPEDIDSAMTKGVNYPKGLLAWADEWGIDRVIDQIEGLQKRYLEPRYRVSPILRDMSARKSRFFN